MSWPPLPALNMGRDINVAALDENSARPWLLGED